MTLFFNVQNLEKESGTDQYRFLGLLKQHFERPVIKKLKHKLSLEGNNFILNPLPLFSLNEEIAYKLQYIKLAAKRDYTYYKFYSFKGLDLSFWPDIDLTNLRYNPLIKIANNHIYFKYEERKQWH